MTCLFAIKSWNWNAVPNLIFCNGIYVQLPSDLGIWWFKMLSSLRVRHMAIVERGFGMCSRSVDMMMIGFECMMIMYAVHLSDTSCIYLKRRWLYVCSVVSWCPSVQTSVYETFIHACSWRPLFVSKGLFQPKLCSLRWLSSWPLKYPPYKVVGMLARWCSLFHRWAIFVPQSVGVVPEIKYQQRDASETTFVVSWWCSFVSIHLEGRLVHVQ